MKKQKQQQLAKSVASEWQAANTALNQLDLVALTSHSRRNSGKCCVDAWVRVRAFNYIVSQDTNHTGSHCQSRLTMWGLKLSLKAQQEQPVEVESRRRAEAMVGGGRRQAIVRLPFAIKLVVVVVNVAFVSCASTATQATQQSSPKVARTKRSTAGATSDKTLQITLSYFCDLLRSLKVFAQSLTRSFWTFC